MGGATVLVVAHLGAVSDGEWGWDICGRRLDHGALRRPGEGNERSSPCIYLPNWQRHLMYLACHNPAEPVEFASDCDPSFSPCRRVSWVEWALGGGGGYSPRLPLLIDGPVDPGSASSGTNSCAVFWGAVRAPGVRGCWGAVPCGAYSPPPLAVALRGHCVFLLWGDLPNLSYLNFAHGCDGTVHRLQFLRDCHMGSIAGRPPWLRRKIQARVSDDIPAACI